MPRTPFRLKCDTIPYRKGFVEVVSQIHEGCVNLETFHIHVDTDLKGVAWLGELADSGVVGNCELELTFEEARQLAETLLAAIPASTELPSTVLCEECGSLYFSKASKLSSLCPECAHALYGDQNCPHQFSDGRCTVCYWDGSVSAFVRGQRGAAD